MKISLIDIGSNLTHDSFDADRDAVDEMSLSELARRIGVSRSSAFRLVHTLERLGYLDREDETKNYRLGARVLALDQHLHSLEVASPALEDAFLALTSDSHS